MRGPLKENPCCHLLGRAELPKYAVLRGVLARKIVVYL
jgi:hypothetical protein